MNNKMQLIGKALINSSILLILPLPLLSYDIEDRIKVAYYLLGIMLLGCLLCVIGNGDVSNPTSNKTRIKDAPVKSYFKIIKWTCVVIMVFHIIAALLICFFYWLKIEPEGTLLITVLGGIVLGFLFEVAIPIYKNYKDENKKEN